mgnify:CR=1 FL=1
MATGFSVMDALNKNSKAGDDAQNQTGDGRAFAGAGLFVHNKTSLCFCILYNSSLYLSIKQNVLSILFVSQAVRCRMYQRIRDLREDADLRQQDMAEYLQCTQVCYSYYESGKRDIPTDVLIRIARYYDVSVDYLLGLTDRREAYPARKQNT